jgi:hypothetical protein
LHFIHSNTCQNMTTEKRTLSQNAAMHLYFQLLAEGLNDAGLDMKKVLKPSVAIPWTKQSIKNHLWKPVQLAMFDTESTKKLEKKQVSMVYETLNRHMSTEFSTGLHFPCVDEAMLRDLTKTFNPRQRK